MKKIIITQRLISNDNYFEIREALDIQWGKLLKEISFIPIILPIEYDFEIYFDKIEIDGVILTGGNDLNSINPSNESLKRDIFEKELIKYSIKRNVPIFGVCRGMQIIAEYFGSTFKEVENQVAVKHTLKVNKESKYKNLLSKLTIVNSYHHYAVDGNVNDILISATSENGIIKAIEHKKYKIFAQMWHSERENKFDKDQLNLIKYFFSN